MWLSVEALGGGPQFHLGLRALRWLGSFFGPQKVANGILAGNNFSNAHARNMLRGILAQVHVRVPMVGIDQHVDGWAHCAVRQRAFAVRRMIDAAQITSTSWTGSTW